MYPTSALSNQKGGSENGRQKGGNMLERGSANDVANLMDMHKEGGGGGGDITNS